MMRAGEKMGLLVLVAMLAGLGAAHAQQAPVDLLTALQSGQLWAQFWGAGPTAVQGVVGRSTFGPESATISPGTQLWGQYPGMQGMSTLGSVQIDLSGQRLARVHIPVACTNLGLRTPTPGDRMVLAACPDRRMARLAAVIGKRRPSHPAAQLAVWAVANDPPREATDRYLYQTLQQAPPPEALADMDLLVSAAANVLKEAGLQPAAFRMFH